MRSAKQWRELFHDKRGTRALADFILSDLSGYRDNAAYRTDDTDSLAEALDAMLIEGASNHEIVLAALRQIATPQRPGEQALDTRTMIAKGEWPA